MSSSHCDRILIVEDDLLYAQGLLGLLSDRFEVRVAKSAAEAEVILAEQTIHGVLLDIRLENSDTDTSGLALLRQIKEEMEFLPVVMMTSFGTIDLAVKAIKEGADHFVEKGLVTPEELIETLEKVIQSKREKLRLRARSDEFEREKSVDLVSSSSAMEPVMKAIDIAAADGHCSVLITGETGTGKELVARSIHKKGWRSQGPFVPVATPALSPTLLESELFGHEKGSFTGATQRHIGYIEQANGGVLFLDEIGDLAPDLQAKLLRFLQERVISRVGSTKTHPIDVQIVAATHRPLNDLVEKGEFREDLYFRFRTAEIQIPPLRSRKEDILPLATHFLEELRKAGRTKVEGFSKVVTRMLKTYSFPGNVRELKSIVEWSVLTANHEGHWAIEPSDLPQVISTGEFEPESDASSVVDVETAVAIAELDAVNTALELAGGNKAKALKVLGYGTRQTMRRRVALLKKRFPKEFAKRQALIESYKSGEVNES